MAVWSNFFGRRENESVLEDAEQYFEGRTPAECAAYAARQGIFNQYPLAVILTETGKDGGAGRAAECASVFYQYGLLRTDQCSEHWLLQLLSSDMEEEAIAAELCRESLKQEKLVVLKDFYQFFYWREKAVKLLYYLAVYLCRNGARVPVVIPMSGDCYEKVLEIFGDIQNYALVFGAEKRREKLPWYEKNPELLEKEMRRGSQYFRNANYQFGYLKSTGQPRWLVQFDMGDTCYSVILLYSKNYPHADRNVFLIPVSPSASDLNRRHPGAFRFVNVPETGKTCIDVNPQNIPRGMGDMEAVFRSYYKKLLKLERGY